MSVNSLYNFVKIFKLGRKCDLNKIRKNSKKEGLIFPPLKGSRTLGRCHLGDAVWAMPFGRQDIWAMPSGRRAIWAIGHLGDGTSGRCRLGDGPLGRCRLGDGPLWRHFGDGLVWVGNNTSVRLKYRRVSCIKNLKFVEVILNCDDNFY